MLLMQLGVGVVGLLKRGTGKDGATQVVAETGILDAVVTTVVNMG
jgi:hypothetical protein